MFKIEVNKAREKKTKRNPKHRENNKKKVHTGRHEKKKHCRNYSLERLSKPSKISHASKQAHA